jgi:8-oxo-dGTP pyrophosphatase MutT (NUDIX family)
MQNEVRHVARVLVINDQGQTYLLRGRDPSLPDRAPFWFTPGGKIDDGETSAQAAARELHEEIGVIASPHDLGEVIGTEDCQYHFEGVAYRQNGVFYAYSSNQAALNTAAWTEIEARTIDQGKWWSVADIIATPETIYPPHLATMLGKYLENPNTPSTNHAT